jgi:hypothetical protein
LTHRSNGTAICALEDWSLADMSITFSTSIQVRDNATPDMRAKMAAITPQRLNSFIGPAVALRLKRNFLAMPHNRRGWTPANFYPDAARSTNWQPVPEGVLVSVNKIGVRQRYYGGEIHAVNAGSLTIPVAEEAYGHTARDFDNLVVVCIPGKGCWLAKKTFEEQPSAVKGRRRGPGKRAFQGPALSPMRQRLQFMFRLVKSVEQEPNPDVLPGDDEIKETVATAILDALK